MSIATDRVIAEAAYARRMEAAVSDKTNKNNITTLAAEVERLNSPGLSADSPIGIDTDGVPYLKTGA